MGIKIIRVSGCINCPYLQERVMENEEKVLLCFHFSFPLQMKPILSRETLTALYEDQVTKKRKPFTPDWCPLEDYNAISL